MRRARLFVSLLLCAAAALAGCGSSSTKGGPAKQFVSLGCASCHTLKAVGAHGTVGPNLDELRPDVATVEHQVANGGPGMPSFKSRLTPAQIHALAVYVSQNAGEG